MRNSLLNTAQRLMQGRQVALDSVSQSCGVRFVEVMGFAAMWACVAASFKQANGGSAYLPAIGALKFDSGLFDVHRLIFKVLR